MTGDQTISTPNYPSNYPTDKICTWTVNAPPGYQVMLEFLDFDIEAKTYYHFVMCHYDYVRSGHCNSIFFLFPSCKKSLICLEGKSMTPGWGNTILFRSSQQLHGEKNRTKIPTLLLFTIFFKLTGPKISTCCGSLRFMGL